MKCQLLTQTQCEKRVEMCDHLLLQEDSYFRGLCKSNWIQLNHLLAHFVDGVPGHLYREKYQGSLKVLYGALLSEILGLKSAKMVVSSWNFTWSFGID